MVKRDRASFAPEGRMSQIKTSKAQRGFPLMDCIGVDSDRMSTGMGARPQVRGAP